MSGAVAAAFDRAETYDAHATVQRAAAEWLAAATGPLAPGSRVLEVGCGTGFLAEAAGAGRDGADWLLTDLAPAMLARAERRLAGRPGIRFRLLDGERPDLPDEAPFDLVCANLAVQWFGDLQAGLARLFGLVRPGGRLIVTTLAAGSFAEWRAAHHAVGAQCGTPAYPTPASLAAMRLDGVPATVLAHRFAEPPGDALSFLRGLRAIGAGTPRPGHRPLAPATFRAVCRAFDAAGAVAAYEVALLTFARPAP